MTSDRLCINKRIVLMPRAYKSFLNSVIANGHECTVRGLNTIEILNGSILVRDPLDRVIPDRGRKMNPAFAIAEWYAMMFGVTDIQFYMKFIADYDKFSSDGKTLDGAYASRIHYRNYNMLMRNQIQGIINDLVHDPTSRRAVISIYEPDDLFGGGGKNTPCTLDLQFLIREGKLHLIVYMRSSDVVKGVTYDLFAFTMIQEYIARALDLEPGYYFHNAGSLHFYTDDMKVYNRLTGKRWPMKMPPMPKLDQDDLHEFRDLVENYLGDRNLFSITGSWTETPERKYLLDLVYVLQAFVLRRSAPMLSRLSFSCIQDPTLKYVLRPWIKHEASKMSAWPKVSEAES